MWIALSFAVALFVLGVRLSAFFSGAETGFYRASFLRLNIDAQAGDRLAGRILWFAQHPSYFVATTLVGNNIANYLTTFAIGLAIAAAYPMRSAGWMEILATIALAPLVFIFGELVPKYLYYRAPLYLLRRDIPWFRIFFWLFLVVSFPLIWLSKLFERLGGSDERQLELVLGRSRLAKVLSEGHQAGLLTDVQTRLVHGLIQSAAQRVTQSMTPAGRVLGVSDAADRDEVLDCARKFGLANVAVRRSATEEAWYGYVRVVDVKIAVRRPPHTLIRPMPRIEAASTKLEALLALRHAGAAFGVVYGGEQIQGIVSERGLAQQLFRPAHALGAQMARA